MAPPGSVERDQLIFSLSGEGWTQRDIVSLVKNRGFRISLSTVNRVLHNIEKKTTSQSSWTQISKTKTTPRKLNSAIFRKVKLWASNPNPPTQTVMEKKAKVSQKTISRLLSRLQLKLRRKRRLHKLTSRPLEIGRPLAEDPTKKYWQDVDRKLWCP